MLMKLLRDLSAGLHCVTFDLKGPTTRHGEFDNYKATRKPMPDDLIPRSRPLKDVVRAFSICILEKQGIEADDIIGALQQFRRAGEAGTRPLFPETRT